MIALWMLLATLITLVLGVGAAVLDRAAAGAMNQRRWIWIAALTMSAAIPVVTSIGSRLGAGSEAPNAETARAQEGVVRAPGRAVTQTFMADLIARAQPASLGKLDALLAGIWAGAASLAAVAYLLAAWMLARHRRFWRRARVDGEAVLVAPTTGPAVIGAVRPVIVVPEWSLDLSAEHRSLMLEHERQHVRARDPLMLHIGAAVALLMPWNIAAWWLNRRLRLAVELDCDARVLAGGRDARAYGNLLLEVCSRRLPAQPVLAPALFERTSSLTRRILAMYPTRSRFTRTRVALGAAVAVAAVIIACDMPSPEAVAPDGTNQATKRLYGQVAAKNEPSTTDTRAFVQQYFPAVARGSVEPMILFVVKSAAGQVLFTESKPATELRRLRTAAPSRGAETLDAVRERRATETARAESPMSTGRLRLRERPGQKESERVTLDHATRPGEVGHSLINSLAPEAINTVDVLKRAAGTVAPNAISIITITLKPGAVLPAQRQR